MKLTSRVLLGTLAMTAAVSGNAATARAATPGAATPYAPNTANAHADTADGAGSSDTDALLCPLVTSGPLRTVLDDLNRQSVAESCAGVGAAPAGAVPGRP